MSRCPGPRLTLSHSLKTFAPSLDRLSAKQIKHRFQITFGIPNLHGTVIGHLVFVKDDYRRMPVRHEQIVCKSASNATIAIGEGMDGLEATLEGAEPTCDTPTT